MGPVHATSLWDCFSRIHIHRAQIPRQTIMSFPSPGTLFRRCHLYTCCYFSYHETHKPSLRNCLFPWSHSRDLDSEWIEASPRNLFSQASLLGGVLIRQNSAGRISAATPRLHPECPILLLKPRFHHPLGGQLCSSGHCSSGRCALSWNRPVRSPERTFPIPEKLASLWSPVPSSSLSCLT